MPEEDSIPKLHPFNFIMCTSTFSISPCFAPSSLRARGCADCIANAHVTGSLIGSPSTITEMLKFAGDHKIRGWVKRYPMEKANEAVVSMDKGEARYRYVLVNTKNGGKLEA